MAVLSMYKRAVKVQGNTWGAEDANAERDYFVILAHKSDRARFMIAVFNIRYKGSSRFYAFVGSATHETEMERALWEVVLTPELPQSKPRQPTPPPPKTRVCCVM